MGAKHSKKKSSDNISSSSVYEKSLNSKSEKYENKINIDSREELINELKEKV